MIKPKRCKIWDNDGRPIFDIKESDQKKLEKKIKNFFARKMG